MLASEKALLEKRREKKKEKERRGKGEVRKEIERVGVKHHKRVYLKHAYHFTT